MKKVNSQLLFSSKKAFNGEPQTIATTTKIKYQTYICGKKYVTYNHKEAYALKNEGLKVLRIMTTFGVTVDEL